MTFFLRNKRLIGLALIILAQIGFFSYWYAKESGAFETSYKTIRVETAAYDPRDFLSGQYIQLNYAFSRIQPWNRANRPGSARDLTDRSGRSKYLKKGDTVWIQLVQKGSYFEQSATYRERPSKEMFQNNVIIKGTAKHYNNVVFGIERYFVPEGTKEPNRNDVSVDLKVYPDGKVRIDKVYVKDKIWP